MSQAASNVVRATKAVVTGGGSEVKRYVNDKTQQAQDAADQAAQDQAAADQAAANAGPKAVDVREQFFADQVGAAGAQRSGNESDIAGTSLFSGPRKRGGAARSLYGY
jgi:hypothetical protein